MIIILFYFSQEEYLDFQSFEVRIKSILNQMFGRPNNPPSSTGMMVQTPGVSHGWGQTHTATPMVNNSTFNSNNSLADGLPTNRMNGGNILYCIHLSLTLLRLCIYYYFFFLTGQVINNGRQQLSANTGQMMMPTPGFNNSTNADVYQSHRNGETSRDGGKLPAVGPEFVSQSQLQRQRPAGSDDRLHYSLDQQLGGGFRSNMHQNASGMSGNSAHLANGHMGSQGVLSSTNFSTSSQPLQQQQPVDQLQQVSHVHSNSL